MYEHFREIAVTDVWQRLGAMVKRKFHEAEIGALNPPASEAQIRAAEQAMKLRFPEDLREAYRHFNGTNCASRSPSESASVPYLLVPGFDWADLDWTVNRWTLMRNLEEERPARTSPIRANERVRRGVAYDRKWIPVGNAKSSVFMQVDLNPGPAGRNGQLIVVDLQDTNAELVASSFTVHVERLLDAIDRELIDSRGNRWVDVATGREFQAFDEVAGA